MMDILVTKIYNEKGSNHGTFRAAEQESVSRPPEGGNAGELVRQEYRKACCRLQGLRPADRRAGGAGRAWARSGAWPRLARERACQARTLSDHRRRHQPIVRPHG